MVVVVVRAFPNLIYASLTQDYHPLIAFINDLRLVTNFWLRSGDTASSSNFLSFLENTLEKLENKKISLVRLDSGF